MRKKKYLPEFLSWFKLIILILLVLFQIVVFLLIINFLDYMGTRFYLFFEIIGALIALKILSSNKKYIYKLSWTIFLFLLPIPASVFYLAFGDLRFIKKIKKKEFAIIKKYNLKNEQNYEVLKKIEDEDVKSEIISLYNLSNSPVFKASNLEYFKIGEEFFEDIIKKLKLAKKFILIEFYILARGDLYNEIKEVLFEKVKEGVEVFIVYDKLGSIGRIGKNEIDNLLDNGIKVKAFNNNFLKLFNFLNYRTHRKIVVVDGEYGYTGGNNIGDEYVNKISKYGHWKDMGLRIEGEGVGTFTKIFFKTWILLTEDIIDIDKYIINSQVKEEAKSYIVPFADGPTNSNNVAEFNYQKIIINAKKYVYITTPYLIIDEEMIACLKIAAKSGIDVRIAVPGIPDKKIIYEVTKSHFLDLIRAGVKIYTYTPGFIHGKVIVSDDKVTTVGSINFDFRSLLWNYEVGVYVYSEQFAKIVREDYEHIIENSSFVNDKYIERGIVSEYIYGLLKLLGPLL